MDDFNAVNAVYGSYIGEDAPARETVEVSRLPKDVKVEISMIALKAKYPQYIGLLHRSF